MVALQPSGEKSAVFHSYSYPYLIDVVTLTGTDQPVISLTGYEEALLESYQHS
jgi:hypothetical protein